MSAWKIRVLTALCFLRHVRGHIHLPPPQNVTLLSKDFDMILMWMPGEGSPPDVTYTVKYESQERMDKWIKVPHCKNISKTSCNLTCVLPNFFIKFRGRVKAISGGLQSRWVESEFKEYHLDVELAPPVLDVSIKENLILVNASFPLATCVESFPWMYDLDFWEAGSEDKKRYESIFRKNTMNIDTTALSGNYCLSARSSFQSIDFKHSKFSDPVCVLLNHKAVEWKFPLSAVTPAFVLPFLLTGVLIICLLKQDFRRTKMPRALDFSQLKAAGTTFHCELSEKEFFTDNLICTEKPVSQGKTRSAASNSLPWMVSFLSSSSSSEEEEEEQEDSSTFIPYTEMSQFPKRGLNYQPSRTALGEASLNSRSGGLCVDDGSVLDLTTLGFSLFPTRKNEMHTSGSQRNKKASLSCSPSLGSLSFTDVRYPGPRGLRQHDTDRDECVETTPLQTPAEEFSVKPLVAEQFLHSKNHFTKYYQKQIFGQGFPTTKDSQLNEDPDGEQLICFQTLQVAEDESIASDCDSGNFTEGTPPASTVLSEAFETSNMEEKYGQEFKFKGYQHMHYMPRN
ncbi:interferon lambda receptor 1 [Rhea pennata]|uniref:interferon lambda receptor 1 n=1 Tax=Rhea pennata TaxID=8795 RepID=UPI002E253175